MAAVTDQGPQNLIIGNLTEGSAVGTGGRVLAFNPPANCVSPNEPFDDNQIGATGLHENCDPAWPVPTSAGPAQLSVAQNRFHGRTDYSHTKEPSHVHILALPKTMTGTRLLITDSISPTYEEYPCSRAL